MKQKKRDNLKRINQLSEQGKEKVINKFRNFPILPPATKLASRHQEQVLAEYFPWGCSRLRERVYFERGDIVYSNCFYDYSNICLSIKYGICPFLTAENLQFIHSKFSQTKKQNGNFYLKLVELDEAHNKIMALVRVTSIRPGRTFRFWHVKKGNYYPVGVATIEVVAVGEIWEEDYGALEDVYRGLKRSMLDWKYFNAADGLEQIQREKYIIAIHKNECQKLQTELQQKNLSILDLFSQ